MQLTAILLTVCCLSVTARTVSQSISYSGKDVKLETVFAVIKQQTGYFVFFDDALASHGKPVNVDAKNMPLTHFLDEILKDQPFTYSLKKTTITIARKNLDAAADLSPQLLNPPPITGVIRDAEGNPLGGINVVIKGTKRGVVTDAYGNFNIDANINEVLIISSINYGTKEIKIGTGNAPLIIALEKIVSELDEVQYIAYGTTSRRYSVGNTASVKAADIEKQPVNNPLLALQGRVPGLFITQDNGLPGSSINVRIRGQNSLLKGNTPLYVIDGVPYTSQTLPTVSSILGQNTGYNGSPGGSGNPLNYISPGDIESIEILKDADATSIYGSRAANGAILITTKKGKLGRIKTDINLQTGWGKVTGTLPLLNTQQYLEMRHEALANDGLTVGPTDFDINGQWDTTRYTDWQKELLGGTARYSNIRTSISGGTGNISFIAGATYNGETTVFPGGLSDNKGSVHFSLNATSTNRKFDFQLSGNYLVDHNKLVNTDLTSVAISLSPNAPQLYNADQTLNWAQQADGTSTWLNPLAYTLQRYSSKTNNLISSALLSYQILRGLNIKANFGYTNTQTDENRITPLVYYAPELRSFSSRSALFGNGNIGSWNIEPQLTYKLSQKKNVWETLIGTTISHSNTNRQQLSASGHNSDLVLEDIFAAATVNSLPSIKSVYRYSALFARSTYHWDKKYILNLTARRDGSSRFGKENRFHNFWSIGGAWIFTNEDFVNKQLPFLTFGKLRGSIGTTGSEQIGDYQYLNLYDPIFVSVPYQGATSIQPNGLPNPHLQWEKTRKLELGLDLGFLKDKILLNAVYYKHRSSNQLNFLPQPFTTGFGSMQQNFNAVIQNDGWEFSIISENVKQVNFSWTTNFNISLPRNKLIDYPNLSTSSERNLYVIGKPLSIVKAFNYAGVDPQTGLFLFIDKDGKMASDGLDFVTDKTLVLNTGPRLFGGIQNNIQFKRIELDFLFQFVKQTASSSYSLGSFPGFFYSDNSSIMLANQPIWVMERWQKPGDIKSFQKFSASYPSSVINPMTYAGYSNQNFGDASYIRLKNVSLSWQLPIDLISKLKIQSCKLFTQAQNLITITKYKGLDPESLSILTLPPLRVITVGLQVTF